MNPLSTFSRFNFILASASPRRRELLSGLGLKFETVSMNIDESYPENLSAEEIPIFVCKEKAKAFPAEKIGKDTIVITADTIVWINGIVLGKPADAKEARQMLRILSGNKHEVITGVCLRSINQTTTFFINSGVWFKELKEDEIQYYIENFKPFDKAGAYGIQEWIGYIGIHRIEGSYFNVMGLPIQKLYTELIEFCSNEISLASNFIT